MWKIMTLAGQLSLDALSNGFAHYTHHRVSFVPAQHPDELEITDGFEFIHLNPAREGQMPAAVSQRGPLSAAEVATTATRKVLWRDKDILLTWNCVTKAGVGLRNMGNTCFMNAVLQCLTYTPPLANACLSKRSLRRIEEDDLLCITQQLIQNVLTQSSKRLIPHRHYNTLKKVCRSFRPGRQEDAHEYLVGLLDAMHESSLWGLKPKPSLEVAETSLIYRIFSGKMRSQVKCLSCGHASNTFEPFLHISLEINRAPTIDMALERFTSEEYLDGDNKYKCPKENTMVRAVKRMTIDRAPNVLVLQLKRFEFSRIGRKVNKKVDFPKQLDMRRYMSDSSKGPVMYQLYAVLVHWGNSMQSGHYYCYVKDPIGFWHKMDDDIVNQASEHQVLSQRAYILFYLRDVSCHSHVGHHDAKLERTGAVNQAPGHNGVTGLHRNEYHASRPSAFSREQGSLHESRHHGPNADSPARSQFGSEHRQNADRQSSHREASTSGHPEHGNEEKKSAAKHLSRSNEGPDRVHKWSRLQHERCTPFPAGQVSHGHGMPGSVQTGEFGSPTKRKFIQSSPPQNKQCSRIVEYSEREPKSHGRFEKKQGLVGDGAEEQGHVLTFANSSISSHRKAFRDSTASNMNFSQREGPSESGYSSDDESGFPKPSGTPAHAAPVIQRTSDPKDVLEYLEGHRQNNQKNDWSRSPSNQKHKRRYDELDKEYDRGKVKKVRNNESQNAQSYREAFDDFSRDVQRGRGSHNGSYNHNRPRHGWHRGRGRSRGRARGSGHSRGRGQGRGEGRGFGFNRYQHY
eukprot:jgi/Botrbrau1/20177/Bobra.0173s0075.1